MGNISVGFSASDPAGAAPRVHDPSGVAQVDLYVKGPGEPGFKKALGAAGAAQGGFTFPAPSPGTYSFDTVATDAAGNVEAMPPSPDATTVVTETKTARLSTPVVSDFVTAVFEPPNLYLRLKCPARFKPECLGDAIAMTAKDLCTNHHGRHRCSHGHPMTDAVPANQKPNKWKLVKLTVKSAYLSRVEEFAKRPSEKLLVVRQLIHAKRFNHGRTEAVFHVYRVRSATSP